MATKKTALDTLTLETLLKEAKQEYKETNEIFEESDCTEAMHAAEHWQETVKWLKEKLKEQKKLAGKA